MLSRNLLSLLVSLLLTLSPFASINVAAAVAGKGHCMMMDMPHSSMTGTDSYTQGADGQTMPDGVPCKDDRCNDHNCANHACSAGHTLSLIPSHGLTMPGHVATRHTAGLSTGLLSRTAPPPLRPPV